MEQASTTIRDYSIMLELGGSSNVRLLGTNTSLVFSPRLLALVADAQSDFTRFDEHLDASPLKECIALAIARMETFALAAICGAELPFAHFVAPESRWPTGEAAAKANARKYWEIVRNYHDPDYVERHPFDRDLLISMHAGLVEAQGSRKDRAGQAFGANEPRFRQVEVQGAIACGKIEEYVDDLMAFCSRAVYPTQLQSCIAHFQTHYISPFSSLNAALGNVLSYAMYTKRNYSKNVPVTIAIVTLDRVDHPLDSYTAMEEGAVDPYGLWLFHAVKALQHQIKFMKRIEARFEAVSARWAEVLDGKRCSPICANLAHDLLSIPYVDSAAIQARYGRTAPAANAIIATMVDRGILTPLNGNRRNRVFCAREVIGIYYDFFNGMLPRGWVPTSFTKFDL